ncbi:hypothetical protein [Methanobrevibacter thaueri]|uniref:hypothetical protein n=1 Tax=Methanobrevibacter thaueri TaxID=190975 RepID=UPI0026EC846D|nr:hypothetical protein [Methanobrevibacter thaueri]
MILIKTFLKKLINDPTITTGWILVGSSPNIISITNDSKKAKTTKQNNSNETTLFMFVVMSFSK